jgi:hypothetical protein
MATVTAASGAALDASTGTKFVGRPKSDDVLTFDFDFSEESVAVVLKNLANLTATVAHEGQTWDIRQIETLDFTNGSFDVGTGIFTPDVVTPPEPVVELWDPQITIPAGVAYEGLPLHIWLERSGDTSTSLTATVNVNGTDYQVVFGTGQAQAGIVYNVPSDGLSGSAPEPLQIAVVDGPGYTLGTDVHLALPIQDMDPAQVVGLLASDTDYTAPGEFRQQIISEGQDTFSYTFTREGTPEQLATELTATFQFLTNAGSATPGADFTLSAGQAGVAFDYVADTTDDPNDPTDPPFAWFEGTVTFAPGETTKTVFFDVVQDDLVEASEHFSIQLTPNDAYTRAGDFQDPQDFTFQWVNASLTDPVFG